MKQDQKQFAGVWVDHQKAFIISKETGEYAVKEKVLKVQNKTLNTVGAVSEETVKEMVLNVMQIMNTDYAIAVSGIMGPGGETQEKPIGTAWVAVACKSKIITKKFQFRFDRARNIQLTATNALNLMRQLIVDNR